MSAEGKYMNYTIICSLHLLYRVSVCLHPLMKMLIHLIVHARTVHMTTHGGIKTQTLTLLFHRRVK